ncbi:MAG TPA: alpha/beta hydrolase [Alphaproteobacteria bacterium]|nr:alpha/beta hydrolase [Alphaproteobacteria bacterium]
MTKEIHCTATVNGLKMHYVEAGSGPPVILLHGFPETWYCWRHQIPALAERYRIIAPDLRGYGETTRPTDGYDKRTMAADVLALMHHLGIEKAAIVGHDRGARVAARFAKDYPQAVDRLVIMDAIPTLISNRMNGDVSQDHWFFILNNVPDLPEMLIGGREEAWLRFVFSRWCFNPEMLSDEEIGVYVKAYSKPGALHGAFSDYRAGCEDVQQDETDKDVLIDCPTLVLWGEDFEVGGKMWDFRGVWTSMASHPSFVPISQCGHLPHEEKPERVNAELVQFLDSWKG